MDVPGVHFGEFVNVSVFLERHRREKGVPFGAHFGPFASMVAVCFLLFFWMRHFLVFCSFKINLGSNLEAFLGYLGTLEMGLKR